MSILDLFRRSPSNSVKTVSEVVQQHLASMNRSFRSSPNYARSAPFWKRLSEPSIQQWLETTFDALRQKGGVATVKTQGPDGPILLTVVDRSSPDAIRAAFAPKGYFSHIERYGFFDAPQQGKAAAAFVLGYDPAGMAIRGELTWFPPIDNQAYQAIVAQDILTPSERSEIGI